MSILIDYINKFLSKKEYELEFRFAKLSYKIYEDIYKIFIDHGFVLESEKQFLRCSIDSLRVEVNSLDNIKSLCITNVVPLNSLYIEKKQGEFNINKEYNYKLSLSTEKDISKKSDNVKRVLKDWSKLHKYYRLIYRVSLVHKDFNSVRIDFSTVKSSNNLNNLFNTKKEYEIEIEIKDRNNNNSIIEKHAKTTLKYLLMGIQNTNFPIKKSEIDSIKNEYKSLYNSKKLTFIGPNSVTLQPTNLLKDDIFTNPYIIENFCITEKADGERRLLYISNNRKIYMISNRINITYTGIDVKTDIINGTLIDGEFIKYDKNHNIINLYAAFDLYFINIENKHIDIRKNEFKKRYKVLKEIIKAINRNIINNYDTNFTFICKKFYFQNKSNTIYNNCRLLMENEYIYNTDGIIFTHQTLGVGMESETDYIKNKPYTWRNSFKWKPPEQNTIDFKIIFTNNILKVPNENVIELYKKVELHVIYNEKEYDSQKRLLNNIKIQSDDIYIDKFISNDPFDGSSYVAYFRQINDELHTIENNDIINNDDIVECQYIINNNKNLCWKPLRIRHDKIKPNSFTVAQSNWFTIHNPVTKDMLTNKSLAKQVITTNKYYNDKTVSKTNNLRNFHNRNIKDLLYKLVSENNTSIIDFTVGKGGDIKKYYNSNYDYVLGIDINDDNIKNTKDGACVRYLNMRQEFSRKTYYLFIQGDSSKNIKNGDFSDDKISKDIVNITTGKDNIKSYKFINESNLFSNFANGFDVGSIQFGIHYMFKNEETLHSFVKNCSELIKLNGFLIGTCFDGKKVFDLINNLKTNEKYELYIDSIKIWHIRKLYNNNKFDDDKTSLGYKIGVYQDSINNENEEYLVNFEYFKEVMKLHGFTHEDKIDKYNYINNFKYIYDLDNIDKTNYKLSKNEKKISFLNNYFIFRKTSNIIT